MSERKQRKKPGPPPGHKIIHGAYSLIARIGELPSKRIQVEVWLTEVRAGLIRDIGPTEKDLTTAQAILIDRVIGKLGIVRCIEEYIREKGVMKGEDLRPPLGTNYLAWANSVRLDLMALGLDRKASEAIVLSPADLLAEAAQDVADEEARAAASIALETEEGGERDPTPDA